MYHRPNTAPLTDEDAAILRRFPQLDDGMEAAYYTATLADLMLQGQVDGRPAIAASNAGAIRYYCDEAREALTARDVY